jgi:hypothetical protein
MHVVRMKEQSFWIILVSRVVHKLAAANQQINENEMQ